MKPAMMICVALVACGKQDDATKPSASPTVAAKPTEAAKPVYSADAATRELDALAACTSQYSCPAFDTLAAFGAAAGPQLVAFVTDLGKPDVQRGLVALLIGKAKLPEAGPKLVEIGLSSKDVTVEHNFLEAAGLCGGDATFAALTAEYDRENHGDMDEHLVELVYGLQGFPAKAKTWAMGALPTAKDQVKYIDVLVRVATAADRDALAALIATTKDQMAKNRLASKAIELGATDPALWDVLIAGLSSSVNYDRDDAGHMLQDIADKMPADKKAKAVALIKKSLAAESDPLLQGGLQTTLKKLGG